jgi:hypothetical protein
MKVCGFRRKGAPPPFGVKGQGRQVDLLACRLRTQNRGRGRAGDQGATVPVLEKGTGRRRWVFKWYEERAVAECVKPQEQRQGAGRNAIRARGRVALKGGPWDASACSRPRRRQLATNQLREQSKQFLILKAGTVVSVRERGLMQCFYSSSGHNTGAAAGALRCVHVQRACDWQRPGQREGTSRRFWCVPLRRIDIRR